MRIKKISKIAEKVMKYDEDMQQLTDDQIKDKTCEWQDYLKKETDRKKQEKMLNDLLPEAFALAREAAYRSLGMKPFKVQIMGSIVLHYGDISEMKTGEGKTLTATMAVYLNALLGRGVHVITVNEYLSEVQRDEMSDLYNFLGLSVGLNLNSLSTDEKRIEYAKDITYTTNSELGFDYLRDNMVHTAKDRVMRKLNYAIVDEVDSILIDEARTPLIISGASEDTNSQYLNADIFVKMLTKDDYEYDEKTKQVNLTEQGMNKAEKMFGIDNLFDLKHSNLLGHINLALKAYVTLQKDVDYMVNNGEVLIVDQFTGRAMPGRRFSEGLHQALEAKEKVDIQKESKTVASITYQNYFRMYTKLAGMTGTAKTEEEEFRNIYNLQVTCIPTNRPIQRKDYADLIYLNHDAKFKSVANKVEEKHKMGQPILIGTASVETSEIVSNLLQQRGIPHDVLNAKNHEREADIISKAGEIGSVTIATNMAGRGTDIKLIQGAEELGGLAVIGTERHESRRIDDQLRGRSGRQGNVGDSQFYLSLQDELMVRFGSERLQNIMSKLVEPDMPIQSKMVSKSIESAQKRVEGNNFDSRKRVLEYDEVLKKQRDIIYSERDKIIDNEIDKQQLIEGMMKSTLRQAISICINRDEPDVEQLNQFINEIFIATEVRDLIGNELSDDKIFDILWTEINQQYQSQLNKLGDYSEEFLRIVLLDSIDYEWTGHIDAMDQLRQGIHLRSYGQQNPLRDYQNEGHRMFEEMMQRIEEDICKRTLQSTISNNNEDPQ